MVTNGPVDVLLILNFAVLGLVGLVGWFGNNYFKNIRDDIQAERTTSERIERHLATLNSRTSKMEVWQEQHGKLDDDRQQSTIRWLETLDKKIDLREKNRGS